MWKCNKCGEEDDDSNDGACPSCNSEDYHHHNKNDDLEVESDYFDWEAADDRGFDEDESESYNDKYTEEDNDGDEPVKHYLEP